MEDFDHMVDKKRTAMNSIRPASIAKEHAEMGLRDMIIANVKAVFAEKVARVIDVAVRKGKLYIVRSFDLGELFDECQYEYRAEYDDLIKYAVADVLDEISRKDYRVQYEINEEYFRINFFIDWSYSTLPTPVAQI